ncbi:MAG TPA: NADH-quinone oxidoreductase subunit L [Candidatus Dormibacteraeota bacterium]
MTGQLAAILILVLPALGGIFLGGFNWRGPRLLTQLIGPGVVWLAFLVVLWLFFSGTTGDYTYWTWIRSGGFSVPFNLHVDHLSVFMCLVITGVGGLIVTYAVGYMDHETDGSYARFFCYMDVFVLSMLLLVLAGNVVFLIMGWAGVGLSSYLLIGFYYWRRTAVVAARKAFVMNVIGDVGMILAGFVLFVTYHQITYSGLFGALGKSDSWQLELAGFLLLVGGIAKSAQLPLHTWLPDAMEGPTPVSALIHAATMVTAGVYLVARFSPLYNVATGAHASVAIVGAVSALFAATVALVQTDIKRVLAYSTMSQIGYMFLAVGVGAYSAGMFHLLSHAFFKALLFMAAGNVIHALADEQDMRRYGGLWKDMRTTSITFLVGSLSLAGIIPFVGFFSKESVLGEAFSSGTALGYSVWAIGFVTAVLTAFYTGRMWWFAFVRPAAPYRPAEHPHEAAPVMLVPVAILAVLATFGGALQTSALGGWHLVSDFLKPVVGEAATQTSALELAVTTLTLLLAIAAFLLARQFWLTGAWSAEGWRRRLPAVTALLEHKYYFDEIYDAVFVRGMDTAAHDSERFLEAPLIDGAVRGVGSAAESSASGLSMTQSGLLRSYLLVFLGGAVVAAALVLYTYSRLVG